SRRWADVSPDRALRVSRQLHVCPIPATRRRGPHLGSHRGQPLFLRRDPVWHARIAESKLLQSIPGPANHDSSRRSAMPHLNEIETFRAVWDREAQGTIRLLEALPTGQYDYRPDPKGRSIGELAWHLSEIDGCVSFGVVERRFKPEDTLPELVRPREVGLLAP